MSTRKAISKTVRFEVFKRDAFTCQYCGRSAPDVVLEIDHILPVSKGGDNDILNLVTSCSECNNGKSNRLLNDDSVVQKQKEQLKELNEKREQLRMMIEWCEELKRLDEDVIDSVKEYVEKTFKASVSEHGEKTIGKWIKRFDLNLIFECIDRAAVTYIKTGDVEEINKAFEMVPRICSRVKRKKETGIDERALFYCRGIIKKRFTYCNDQLAISLLRQAAAQGHDEDELKDYALSCRNWTEWKGIMEALAGGEW